MDEFKVLCIGDPHLKLSNISALTRLRNEIINLIAQTMPNWVVILGDLHDTHEKINVFAWLEERKFLSQINAACLGIGATLYYVLGNHDIPSNNLFLEQVHPFVTSSFDNPLGMVIDYPTIQKSPVGRFAFVPYVPNGRFKEALGVVTDDMKGLRTIFCHQEFKNANLGQSIISKDGDEWPVDAPMVVSGHIHTRQWLQTNLYYVGTAYQVNFGEEEEKTVSLLTYTQDSVKIKDFTLAMPRKKTFTTSLSNLEEIEFFPENENRLIITDTSVNIARFKASDVYKHVQDVAKVVFKPTDKVFIKRNVTKKTFLEILRESVAKEDQTVADVFDEVVRASHS